MHGDVQGVFFRDSCRQEAQASGVTGWVRNTSSGTVEGWFEGTDQAVDALVAWCEHGPPHARVERVEREDVSFEGAESFEAR